MPFPPSALSHHVQTAKISHHMKELCSVLKEFNVSHTKNLMQAILFKNLWFQIHYLKTTPSFHY